MILNHVMNCPSTIIPNWTACSTKREPIITYQATAAGMMHLRKTQMEEARFLTFGKLRFPRTGRYNLIPRLPTANAPAQFLRQAHLLDSAFGSCWAFWVHRLRVVHKRQWVCNAPKPSPSGAPNFIGQVVTPQ